MRLESLVEANVNLRSVPTFIRNFRRLLPDYTALCPILLLSLSQDPVSYECIIYRKREAKFCTNIVTNSVEYKTNYNSFFTD